MTPTNPDALAEALAQYYREEHAYLRSTATEKARRLVAGPLAPLLADLQQQAASIGNLEESVNSLEADLQRVTAERDAAREDQKATESADDIPTDAEIQAMHEEAENFRLPTPPPIPVRDPYYLTECEHCGWIGSSEQCGGDAIPGDDDIICAVCCCSICGDSPDEADTAKHGEAVYQRIVAAEARAAQLQAEVEALKEISDDYRGAAITHISMEGVHYRGVSTSAYRHAWEAHQEALAARAATAREGQVDG